MTAEGAGVSERERLAKALWLEFYDWTSSWEATDREQWLTSADALLAAGFGDLAQAKAEAIVTTSAELDALPELSVIVGTDDCGQVVARKPLARDFPSAVDGFWEIVGSCLGTDSTELIDTHGALTVVYTPNTPEPKA